MQKLNTNNTHLNQINKGQKCYLQQQKNKEIGKLHQIIGYYYNTYIHKKYYFIIQLPNNEENKL